MEILILTGKFGMGHWSAALSLQEQLERDGHHAQVIDFFDYAMPDIAPALYRGFNLLVTYGGGIYNLFHRMTRNTPGEVPLAGQFTRRLAMLLDEVRPDAVLSTHPVCSGVAARYKAEYGSVLPLITCITDVTAHSEWLHPGTDCYLVPSASVRDALRAKGVDPSRAAVTGIPVRARFAGSTRPEGGRRELLIMGGGLGLMPRKDSFYEALNALPGVHTTILTGKNEKLYHRLAGKYPNIEVVAFTDRVADYMARAHLMLSKPGGITTFEAIAARLPMLAWEPFLAQEQENARFLTAHGMARVVPKDESDCLAAIRDCIYDDALLGRMGAAMDRMSTSLRRQAASLVVERLADRGAQPMYA